MITKIPFLTLANRQKASLFSLKNQSGIEVQISNLGCSIISIQTPDKLGQLANIVLQYKNHHNYIENLSYFGCVVGRFANRITNSQFSINGQKYQLTKNEGQHHLHGGQTGFHHAIWQASILDLEKGQTLRLFHTSADGDEGYPGKILVCVDYTLTEQSELWIEYSAITDKPTHVNLTNHSYFNLAGTGTIENHLLKINSDTILPLHESALPTGEFRAINNTAFDFLSYKPIAKAFEQDEHQISLASGFNHTYVLKHQNSNALVHAASLIEPKSGRKLDVFTTQPGVLFYSGQCLDENTSGYAEKSGLCLETQHFPDTPNHSQFPSSLLKPGEMYQQKNCLKFSVDKI